jgi:hypothetical protein
MWGDVVFYYQTISSVADPARIPDPEWVKIKTRNRDPDPG